MVKLRTSAIISHGHAEEIPTIIGCRVLVDSDQTFGNRVSVLRLLRRCLSAGNLRVTSFNAWSVLHKSAAIQEWIRGTKLTVAAQVETWHDDAHSPGLIACIPPDFTLIERARPRNDDLSLLTNHGGVYLLCDVSQHAREIPLPVFSSFETVCAYIHRSGLSAVLVVVYRTGNVTQDFYDQFSDLLERLATFSASLIVVGDFNIHVDDPTDVDANKFARLIFQLEPRYDVTPSLIQLHWPPVRSRVQYKLCLFMHHIYTLVEPQPI
jgi:hypothetical protein